jgi:hypothetical protein
VKNLDSDILVGIPFMKANEIVLDIPNDQIIIQGKEVITYNNPGYQSATPQIRRSQSYLLRDPAQAIIHAGEFIELNKPEGLYDDVDIAMEPRCDSPMPAWPPPAVTQSIAGAIRIPNHTLEPIVIKKNQHLAQIRYTYDCVEQHDNDKNIEAPTCKISAISASPNKPYYSEISMDPNNQMSRADIHSFHSLHAKYDQVFDPKIGKYNDASGKMRAYINISPVTPPTQKVDSPCILEKTWRFCKTRWMSWKTWEYLQNLMTWISL